EGFTLHTENNSHILISSKDEAFLNPVQEFNRDLSVACIRTWSEEMNREKEEKWKKAEERRSKRLAEAALSATGLRSIRYAKEIPLVRFVIANDLSSSATAAMKRNVELNALGPTVEENEGNTTCDTEADAQTKKPSLGKKTRVDVVDLDPYGTAAPFIDAAVQAINDGGLLCVTCTDLAVLATTNYSEKCFSNYGGIPVKAEYCHEAALRLVLNTMSTSASRYGRYIEPLLSLSVD
ncbi:hypothetical protein BS17DRAFT_635778, partial [Gyrodon lividus]